MPHTARRISRSFKVLLTSYARNHGGIFIVTQDEQNRRVDAAVYCMFPSSFDQVAGTVQGIAKMAGLSVEVRNGTTRPADVLTELSRSGMVLGDRRWQPRAEGSAAGAHHRD
jgi:hypothetical protein